MNPDRKKKIIRIITITCLSLLALIACAGVYIYFYTQSMLPDWDGELDIASIKQPVTITLDDCHVPHIFAGNEEDLFFAIGFTQARERLFQMDMNRRHAAGTLSEMFGRMSFGIDRKMRGLLLTDHAEKELVVMSGRMKTLLERYTEGVNYEIENGSLPFEYRRLDAKPEAWKSIDTIMIWLDFSLNLSSTGGELENGKILDSLGAEWLRFLRDVEANVAPDQLPESATMKWALGRGFDKSVENSPAGTLIAMRGDSTSSGKPLLAADMQMKPLIPTQFFQTHIKCPGIDAAGLFPIGIPFPLTGRNTDLAWAAAPSMVDTIDFFELVMNPRYKNQYLYQNRWTDIELKSERFRIKNRPDRAIEYKSTAYGPVITGPKWEGTLLAMKWTGMSGRKVSSFDTVYRMIKSTSTAELVSSMKEWEFPHLNFAYSDVNGATGALSAGLLPQRKGWSGKLPVKANGRYDWTGVHQESGEIKFNSADELIILTSNSNRLFIERRINTFQRENSPLTAEYLAEILTDTYSMEAELLLAKFADTEIDNPVLAKFLDKMKKWDKKMDGGSEPALYLAFRHSLMWYLLADDIRAIDRKATSLSRQYSLPLMRAIGADGYLSSGIFRKDVNWWDNIETPQIEDMMVVIKNSLSASREFLKKYYAHRWADKNWADMHKVSYLHPLGRSGLEKKIFNRIYELDGERDTMNSSVSSFQYPFAVNRLQVYRLVFDLSDSSDSLIIKNLGQSGHPFSSYYADEAEVYKKGKYYKVVFSDSDLKEKESSKLLLLPVR